MYLVNIFTRNIVKINYFTSMKKFAFLLATLFALFAVSDVQAQKTANLKSVLYPTSNTDTVANSGNREQKIASVAYSPVGKIEVTVTKVSGTVAGSVVASGSVDGTTWFPLDTLTATNVASQTLHLDIGATKYWFYKIKHTGTGTMNAIISSKIKVK